MSDESHESKSSIVSLIGNAFLVLVPLALIVMMGIVGFAFIKGTREEPVKPEAIATAAPAAKSAAPAAPAAPAAVAKVAAPAITPVAVSTAAPAAAGGAIDPAVMKLGQASYAMCAACHGADGAGIKAGPALMAPSFHGSETLLGDPDISLLVLLKGIAKENMDYMGAMMPLGAALDDEKLAAVLTFVRNSWGNSASAVSVAQTTAARAKFAGVETPAGGVKRAELKAVVDAHK